MYTRENLIQLADEMTEGRVSKITPALWLDTEISKIVNEQRWWWRRKTFDLSLASGTGNYNLSQDEDPLGNAGLDAADDFEQMIQLARLDGSTSPPHIQYKSSADEVHANLANTATGDPGEYIIVPGTTKTLRFGPIPSTVVNVRGFYWASYNPRESDVGDPIPLIPDTHHHVVLECYLRRIYGFLFGEGDNRYTVQVREAERALGELRRFRGPGLEFESMRSESPNDYQRATS